MVCWMSLLSLRWKLLPVIEESGVRVMHSFSGATALQNAVHLFLREYVYAVLHRLRADVEFVALSPLQ